MEMALIRGTRTRSIMTDVDLSGEILAGEDGTYPRVICGTAMGLRNHKLCSRQLKREV